MFAQWKPDVRRETQAVHTETTRQNSGESRAQRPRPWFRPQALLMLEVHELPLPGLPQPPHHFREPAWIPAPWIKASGRALSLTSKSRVGALEADWCCQHDIPGGEGKGRYLQPEPDPEYRSSSSSSGKESSSPEPSRSTGLSKFSLRQR